MAFPRSWLNSFVPMAFLVTLTMGANIPFSPLFPAITWRLYLRSATLQGICVKCKYRNSKWDMFTHKEKAYVYLPSRTMDDRRPLPSYGERTKGSRPAFMIQFTPCPTYRLKIAIHLTIVSNNAHLSVLICTRLVLCKKWLHDRLDNLHTDPLPHSSQMTKLALEHIHSVIYAEIGILEGP